MIVLMPLQKITILLNTNIIFTVLFGICFLNEHPNFVMVVLVLTSFLGVVLLVDPSVVGLGDPAEAVEAQECKDIGIINNRSFVL